MRRYLFFFSCILVSYFAFAQDYGAYSIPHTSSEADLQQYVGQRVKVMKYNGYAGIYSNDGHDEYIFSHKCKGVVDKVYTIKKIKVNKKQIIFELIDDSQSKINAKVNIDGAHNYDGMQSCKSFFLVDKFETEKQSIIGKEINNKEGQPVAQVVDVIMASITGSYPQSRYVIKSNFDESTITCTQSQANKLCSYYGTVLSNPKVKRTYKVVGAWMPKGSETYDSKYCLYNLTCDDEPSKTFACKVINPEDDAFKHDLEGHYISILSKVEKPSNQAIRYGKTTTIDGDKVSKFSYIDNIIDILIFGDGKQFNFILKNVSDNSIKIVWNEAVFVNFDGATSKIMHVGTKYSQREADQPATTIIKGAKIEDLAAPNCNVRYSDALKEWVTDSMYPSKPALSPGQLQLMLPIQIKDVINEYIFVFDVKYVYDHPERLNL